MLSFGIGAADVNVVVKTDTHSGCQLFRDKLKPVQTCMVHYLRNIGTAPITKYSYDPCAHLCLSSV